MSHDETILNLGTELDDILNAPADEPLPQKRRFTRITWRIPVVCQQDGEHFGGHVADVGVGGVALDVIRSLEPLSYLSVQGEPPDHGPIRVRVRWCRPEGNVFRAGTALADSQENLSRSWLKAVLVQLGVAAASRDRRKQVRVRCRMPVEVAYGRQTQTGWLIDVGGGAVRCRLPASCPWAGSRFAWARPPLRGGWSGWPGAPPGFPLKTWTRNSVATWTS